MSRYSLFNKIRAIRLFASRVNPDQVWVESVRSTLLMQVKNSLPTEERQPQISLKKKFTYFKPNISWAWVRQPVSVVAALLLALFGGSLLSVSAAEKSLPGDVLYSVKLATEQARLALTKNPKERVKLKSEFTDRRVDEVKQVMALNVSDKKERVVQAAEVLKRDMHTLKQQLEDVKQADTPEAVKESAKMVDQKSVTVVQALQDTKSELSPEDKAKVTEAQAAASDAGVKAIEVLADVHAQDAAVVTDQDMTDAVKTHNENVTKTMADTVLKTPTSTTITVQVSTSTTDVTPPVTVTTSTQGIQQAVQQVTEAQKSLDESGKLADENKIQEAVSKLKEGTQQAFDAQLSLEQASANMPAPVQALPTINATSSATTPPVSTSTNP